MAEIASAFVSLVPSTKGFGSKLNSGIGKDIDSSGKTMGSRFGSAFKATALVGVAAAVALGGFLKGSLDEAREAQKVGALTNAVIKSTGGIANVTAGDVDKLATSISLKTGVDDEAIAAGQNMLLTFGNVRNEVGKGNNIFSQATVAATDMAAAFGGDAVSNSKLLGKALNDPTVGVSALTRVGVSFTAQQKEQIATLQESGKVVGAQKIILGELTKQTGGAAEATATAGDKFRTAFANLQESVGTALLPLFDKALVGATRFVTYLTNDIGPGLAALNGYLAPAIAAVGRFFSALGGGGAASGFLATFQSIGSSIASNFLPVLQTMAATFTSAVLPALLSVATYLRANLFPIFAQVGSIISGQVIPILASLAQFFYGTLYPAVVAIVTAVASRLKPVFDQLFATIQSSVLPVVQDLLAKFKEWMPTIQAVAGVVLKVVGFLLKLAATILGTVLPPLIRFAGFLIRSVVPAVAGVIGIIVKVVGFFLKFGAAMVALGGRAALLVAKVKIAWGVLKVATSVAFNAVKSIISSVWSAITGVVSAAIGVVKSVISNGIKTILAVIKGISAVVGFFRDAFNSAKEAVGNAISGVLNFVRDIPGKIKGLLSGAGTLLLNTGRDIIGGLISGIKSMAGELLSTIQSYVIDKIPGPVKKALGIASPSKVFHKIGMQTVDGLIQGLRKKGGDLQKAAREISDRLIKEMYALVKRRDAILHDFSATSRSEFNLADSITGPNEFGFGGGATFESVSALVRSTAARLKKFAKRIAQMSKAGIPRALIGEVAALGSTQGIQVADALLSGSRKQQKQLRLDLKILDYGANLSGYNLSETMLGDKVDRVWRENKLKIRALEKPEALVRYQRNHGGRDRDKLSDRDVDRMVKGLERARLVVAVGDRDAAKIGQAGRRGEGKLA